MRQRSWEVNIYSIYVEHSKWALIILWHTLCLGWNIPFVIVFCIITSHKRTNTGKLAVVRLAATDHTVHIVNKGTVHQQSLSSSSITCGTLVVQVGALLTFCRRRRQRTWAYRARRQLSKYNFFSSTGLTVNISFPLCKPGSIVQYSSVYRRATLISSAAWIENNSPALG